MTGLTIVFRIAAPYRSMHQGNFFGSFQHEGDLNFVEGDTVIASIRAAAAKVPTIVIIYLDRPALLSPLPKLVKALIAEFGSSDDAILDVLTGKIASAGGLPFALPSSMADVRAEAPDAPHESHPFSVSETYRFALGPSCGSRSTHSSARSILAQATRNSMRMPRATRRKSFRTNSGRLTSGKLPTSSWFQAIRWPTSP